MPSSRVPDEVEDIARALSPHPVRAVTELRSGNNSRVFRVATARGPFALKKYPARDDRDRLGAELAALAFFERRGIGRTPRTVAAAGEVRFALFTWMEGEAVGSMTDQDAIEFARFQVALDEAIDRQARADIGEASEACLSGLRIVSQIERRLRRLEAVKHDVAEFAAFYDGVLLPALDRFTGTARVRYDRLGLDFAQDIPEGARTLIPSDMGAHNALRGSDGRLIFLDFEYFGWDDPLTSIANFVLHPGMRLSGSQAEGFREALLGHFRGRGGEARLMALMPLYALRWCAIILGELLPERWRHRRESNADFHDWEAVRRGQIAKARALIGSFLDRLDSNR